MGCAGSKETKQDKLKKIGQKVVDHAGDALKNQARQQAQSQIKNRFTNNDVNGALNNVQNVNVHNIQKNIKDHGLQQLQQKAISQIKNQISNDPVDHSKNHHQNINDHNHAQNTLNPTSEIKYHDNHQNNVQSDIKNTINNHEQNDKNIHLTDKHNQKATENVTQHLSHIAGDDPRQTKNDASAIVVEMGSGVQGSQSYLRKTKLDPIEQRNRSSLNDEQDIVHDEGVTNFTLPIKNLNLQIEIM